MSFIRSIDMDTWTIKQLKFIELGGNENLFNFLNPYNLNSMPAEKKYISLASESYRQQVFFLIAFMLLKLKCAVEGKEFKPSDVKSSELSEPIENNQNQTSEKFDPLSIIGKGFHMVSNAAIFVGEKTATKLKEAKIGDKLKSAGNAISEKSKEVGGFVIDKAKAGVDIIKEKGKEIGVFL